MVGNALGQGAPTEGQSRARSRSVRRHAAVQALNALNGADTEPHAFYAVLKELRLAGYYTSEAGATRELRVNPMRARQRMRWSS